MTHDTLQTEIDELDDLLDAERRALLAGNLDEIARLHHRKEQLIDELNSQASADQENLASLNTKLQRNQVLLNTALDGIRSVARRLAAIRRVTQSLETYDQSGRKRSVETRIDRSLEKRA